MTGSWLGYRPVSLLACAALGADLLFIAHTAAAEPPPAKPMTAADSLPGSPRPPGPGLSPEAPQSGPPPGGRAPSFGAPTDPDVWSFRFGGKISGYLSTGLGSRPDDAGPGQSSLTLHTPPRTDGRTPFGPGAQLLLNISYGNPVVGAFVNYAINTTGREHEGWYQATRGAAANSAYINVTPQALGNLRLQIKVGAITDSYAGTGQWGWGVLGPLLGTRGYGETIVAEYDINPDWRLFLSHGFAGVPGVPEFFVRGTITGWNETGVSSIVQHGHIGIAYQNRYQLRLHVANAAGTDEREYLAPIDPTSTPISPDAVVGRGAIRGDTNSYRANGACQDFAAPDAAPNVIPGVDPANANMPLGFYRCPAPRDGRMDVVALESHTFLNQWGQFGLSAAYYNLVTAVSVHDGIWWTIDWTQGARETISKYVGRLSSGTGKIGAISAQYDFSLASVLWHPQSFDGRGADVRASVAGIYHWTIDTDDIDPRAKDADGYQLGLELDYRMLPWMSFTLRGYGSSRDAYASPANFYGTNTVDASQAQATSTTDSRYVSFGRYQVFTLSPGLAFRSDWQAPELIEIAYTRYFYNDFVDANSAAPLDENVLTVGAQVSF